jgi:GTP cyclohydrolase I
MRDEVLRLEESIRLLLKYLGEDAGRPDLRDTPRRFLRAMSELTRGLREPAPEIVFFSLDGKERPGPVVIEDIRAASLCEHHLLPIIMRVSVAYVPGDRVPGLSKVIRLVRWAAARPVLQERFTEWLADLLAERLGARSVSVRVCGIHMCAFLRGVVDEHHKMITQAKRGEIDITPGCKCPAFR